MNQKLFVLIENCFQSSLCVICETRTGKSRDYSINFEGKVSLPGLSCHDVTDRVFPYDLGFTVYLRVAMMRKRFKLYFLFLIHCKYINVGAIAL